MTTLKPWAFIFKSPGAQQPRDYAEFTSARHHTFIYGVDKGMMPASWPSAW